MAELSSSKLVSPARLRNVADWLMNGCDVGQAAIELRIMAQELEVTGETPAALPEYTNAIGDAGAAYIRSVCPDGIYPKISGKFYWHELWEALCRAALKTP